MTVYDNHHHTTIRCYGIFIIDHLCVGVCGFWSMMIISPFNNSFGNFRFFFLERRMKHFEMIVMTQMSILRWIKNSLKFHSIYEISLEK